MSVIDTLVTDRTPTDVASLNEIKERYIARTATPEEIAAWVLESKGAYSTTDLNRVGSALLYLQSHLAEYGYAPVYVCVPRTDWQSTEMPTLANMSDYASNIQAVYAVLSLANGTPSPPESVAYLTATAANNIEKILQAVEYCIEHIPYALRHSGTFNSGMEGLRL